VQSPKLAASSAVIMNDALQATDAEIGPKALSFVAPKALTFVRESERSATVTPIESSSSTFIVSVQSSSILNDLKDDKTWTAEIHSSSITKSLSTAELPIASATISRDNVSLLVGTLVPVSVAILLLVVIFILVNT
jgi:hypothetical protein